MVEAVMVQRPVVLCFTHTDYCRDPECVRITRKKPKEQTPDESRWLKAHSDDYNERVTYF